MRWTTPAALVVAASVLSGAAAAAFAAESVVNTGYFGGVAIKGYDTVAYFTDQRAVKGSPEFAYSWLGATWQFASAAHRDAFAATPIRYAPQYGGYCAGGVAFNEVSMNIDPEAFRIVDGKLYLSSGSDAAVREEWDPQAREMIAKADANWPSIQARLAAGK